MRWFRRDRRPEPAPPAPADEVPALRETLRATVRKVNASAGRLPVGAVPEIRDIADQLAGLLDHEERTGAAGRVGPYELATLAAVVRDYLPTSVDTYLALPPEFLATHHNPEGETPAEELLGQLRSMRNGVAELARAIHSGNAQRLSVQGRFLEAKFSSSDLDL